MVGVQILISTHLLPGSVWKTLETFADGTSRLKFLVVVRIQTPLVYYLRTTSKGDHFQRTQGVSYVLIPAGTSSAFTVDTYIGCDTFEFKSISDFRGLLARNRIDYKGVIDSAFLEKIKLALRRSKVLSPKQKDRILG
jgi:hypothetical protein